MLSCGFRQIRVELVYFDVDSFNVYAGLLEVSLKFAFDFRCPFLRPVVSKDEFVWSYNGLWRTQTTRRRLAPEEVRIAGERDIERDPGADYMERPTTVEKA